MLPSRARRFPKTIIGDWYALTRLPLRMPDRTLYIFKKSMTLGTLHSPSLSSTLAISIWPDGVMGGEAGGALR